MRIVQDSMPMVELGHTFILRWLIIGWAFIWFKRFSWWGDGDDAVIGRPVGSRHLIFAGLFGIVYCLALAVVGDACRLSILFLFEVPVVCDDCLSRPSMDTCVMYAPFLNVAISFPRFTMLKI